MINQASKMNINENYISFDKKNIKSKSKVLNVQFPQETLK